MNFLIFRDFLDFLKFKINLFELNSLKIYFLSCDDVVADVARA